MIEITVPVGMVPAKASVKNIQLSTNCAPTVEATARKGKFRASDQTFIFDMMKELVNSQKR